MKLLLDESVPRRLALSFPGSFTLHTVQEMGWAGTANGRPLSLAAARGFDALVTVDRGIERQQNVSELPIPVIVMLAPRDRLAKSQLLVPGMASFPSVPCTASYELAKSRRDRAAADRCAGEWHGR